MYLFFIPLGVIMSRFLKSRPGWVIFHVGIQSTATVGIVIFFAIVLATYQNYSGSHSRLGLTILILTFIQIIMGAAARWNMIHGDIKTITIIRNIHRFNGFFIMIMSVAQVSLGLNILYPFFETRGKEFWSLYIATCSIWFIV